MTIEPGARRPFEAMLQHRVMAGRVLAICSLAAIMFATLQPSEQELTSTRWCIVCGSLGGVDIVLNVLLFVPLGCGLAMAGVRPIRALAAMSLLTLTIETLQFVLIAGRDASIGDLLMNSVGGGIGFGIGASIEAWLTPSPRGAARLTLLWCCVWLTLQGVAGYSLLPSTTSPRYYGQIRRALDGSPPYPGDVPVATIDGRQIPNTSYDKAGVPPPVLSNQEGALVHVDVVPRTPTRRLIPIVRIASASLEEVLLVGQHGTALVFGIRTNAATLHLRPVYFSLRNVFPRSELGAGRDTIRIEARYAARDVRVSADAGGSHHEATIAMSPVMGWRLFLPLRVYAHRETRDRMLDALWLVLLLGPVGYWGACSVRRGPHDGRSRHMLARFIAPFGVLVGLVGVPAAFGLALPGVVEWGGAVCAIAAGVATARFFFRG